MSSLTELIDHTLLSPAATVDQIDQLIHEAIQLRCYSVCVHPTYIEYVKNHLAGISLPICTVIGFPFGAQMREVKELELKLASDDGADEFDIVMNFSDFKNGMYDKVLDELVFLRKNFPYHVIKVIIETSLLSENEISIASGLVLESGADFVKTSTGFGSRGASLEDIKIIRRVVGSKIGVKASGGIKDLGFLKELVSCGASRIGTSQTKTIFADHSH